MQTLLSVLITPIAVALLLIDSLTGARKQREYELRQLAKTL
jgi:hypothetical protein